jgi:hypothetical protein
LELWTREVSATERSDAPPIDAETLAAVAREVIARLGHSATAKQASGPDSKTDRIAASIEDRVISSKTITALGGGIAELFVDAAAVITPSARDEARARGITINRGEPIASTTSHNATSQTAASQSPTVIDRATPDRAAAVVRQLAGRGIRCCSARIVLSDTPAKELYDQYVREGEVAAMVGSIAEVQRFARELDITTWVLDMKRLNLIAAVNVASQIARTGRSRP